MQCHLVAYQRRKLLNISQGLSAIIWGEHLKYLSKYASIFIIVLIMFLAFLRCAASNGEDDLITLWKECSDELKDCLGSIVLPIGSLAVGLCKHRSLLFKVCSLFFAIVCPFINFKLYIYGSAIICI